MKKFILVCSSFLGFAVSGLLAEDPPATVTLPTPPTPAVNPPTVGGDSNASHNTQGGKKGHKGHKGHHKKKGDQGGATGGTSVPAPRS